MMRFGSDHAELEAFAGKMNQGVMQLGVLNYSNGDSFEGSFDSKGSLQEGTMVYAALGLTKAIRAIRAIRGYVERGGGLGQSASRSYGW